MPRVAAMPVLARLPLHLPARPVRAYSTAPNQDQVLQSFSTPFAHFIHTISRIARMIVFTSTGVVAVGALTFEGVHQYVEHVAMPRSQAQSQERDPWGWTDDSMEEGWGGKGTDPRLGVRGRHILRSAWICSHWGGGISPASFVAPGAGLPSVGGSKRTSSFMTVDEGLGMSERFLEEALKLAEVRGIRIPDLAAVRVGIESAAALNGPLDWTALTLETKLASIRERLGGNGALLGSLSGYTRVFDVLSNVDTINRGMKSEGHESGQPTIPTQRLVRLATKVGDIHSLLGNREEAEDWLLRAVSLAGKSAQESQGKQGRNGQIRSQIIAGAGGLRTSPAEVEEAAKALKSGKQKDEPTPRTESVDSMQSLHGLTGGAPSPALTRSLISTLLSLSAFYAQPGNKSQLEKALQFQASALRLTRVEKERLSLSDDRNQPGSTLHALWLMHHDALASIHIAETIYALQGRGSGSYSFGSLLSSLGMSSKGDKHAQTIEWLNEASQSAKAVTEQLGKSTRRTDEAPLLLSKWVGDVRWEVPASRLLRDAQRLQLEVEGMKKALSS